MAGGIVRRSKYTDDVAAGHAEQGPPRMEQQDWEAFEAEEKRKAAAGELTPASVAPSAPPPAPAPAAIPTQPVSLPSILDAWEERNARDDEEEMRIPCSAGGVILRYPKAMTASDFALVSKMLTTFWKSKKASLVKP